MRIENPLETWNWSGYKNAFIKRSGEYVSVFISPGETPLVVFRDQVIANQPPRNRK